MKDLSSDHVPPPASVERPGGGDPQPMTRTATEMDLPGIRRLDQQIFTEDPYPLFVLRQLLDAYPDCLLVVYDGAELCGYVVAASSPWGRCGWIWTLGVDTRFRGRGFGRRLMTEMIDTLRRQGAKEIRLAVEPTNSVAIRLYKSLGFTRQYHHKDYFGEGADRLIMALTCET
jgi:ribosomal protein S18 acetylase RimI-like enzyme